MNMLDFPPLDLEIPTVAIFFISWYEPVSYGKIKLRSSFAFMIFENPERREKMNFEDIEEIIDFAERCLDTLAIKEQKKYLFEQYEGNIPGITNHMPNLLQKTMWSAQETKWSLTSGVHQSKPIS